MDYEKSVKIKLVSYEAVGLRAAVISRLDSVRQAVKDVLPGGGSGWRIDSVDITEDGLVCVEFHKGKDDAREEAVVYLNNDGTPSCVVTDHPAYQQ